MAMIFCGVCDKAHEPAFPGATTQGDGCAAEVHGGRITGDYGSAVADLHTYRMLSAPLPDGTIVCDTCLTAMLDKGEIVLESGYTG